MNNIERATHIINETYADEYVRAHMTPAKVAQALADAGLLTPDLPEAVGKTPGGAPIYRACEFEVRPAGYEHRVICTDENGPWESTAQDVRNFAASLLAAANYAEENQ